MLYVLYKVVLFILRVTTHDVAHKIASFCAKLKYIFSKRDRDLVKDNLRTAIPGLNRKEISRLAQGVFINFGKYLVDFFSLIKNQKGYLEKVIQLEGLKNIDEALRSGNGCIILSGHFGNWELAACALANLGYKLNVVALAHSDPRINNLFIEQRKRAGVNAIPIGRANSACQRALRQGEAVAILGDRVFGDRGIEVNFFGKRAIAPRGAALFSLKNKSPIVLAFSYGEGTTYKLVFEEPFLVKREGCLDKQLKEITQRFLNRFEHYIRRYPSQWYMFNKVWREQ